MRAVGKEVAGTEAAVKAAAAAATAWVVVEMVVPTSALARASQVVRSHPAARMHRVGASDVARDLPRSRDVRYADPPSRKRALSTSVPETEGG